MDRPSFFDSSREHFIFTLFPTMPLSVSDRVKSSAVLYDQGTEDENGLTFSQRQLGKGLGAFCFGEVTVSYESLMHILHSLAVEKHGIIPLPALEGRCLV